MEVDWYDDTMRMVLWLGKNWNYERVETIDLKYCCLAFAMQSRYRTVVVAIWTTHQVSSIGLHDRIKICIVSKCNLKSYNILHVSWITNQCIQFILQAFFIAYKHWSLFHLITCKVLYLCNTCFERGDGEKRGRRERRERRGPSPQPTATHHTCHRSPYILSPPWYPQPD